LVWDSSLLLQLRILGYLPTFLFVFHLPHSHLSSVDLVSRTLHLSFASLISHLAFSSLARIHYITVSLIYTLRFHVSPVLISSKLTIAPAIPSPLQRLQSKPSLPISTRPPGDGLNVSSQSRLVDHG
jgi:hypothetical protein